MYIYHASKPVGYILYSGKLSYANSEKTSAWFKLDNSIDVQYEDIERYRMAGRSFMFWVNVEF